MKNNEIEKNFKDQLGNYESFDGDKMAMWEGIEQELDKKKKRRFLWFWLSFGVLIIGGFVTWMLMTNDNNSTLSSQEVILSSDTIQTKKLTTTKHNNTFTNQKNIKTEVNSSNKKSTSTISNNTTTTSFFEKNKISNTFNNNTITNSSSSSSLNSNIENSITEVIPIDTKKEISNVPTLENTSAQAFFLPALWSELFWKNKEIENLDLEAYYILKKKKEEEKKNWAISLGGGFNYSDNGYNNTSTFSEIRNSTESVNLGWNVMLELERRLPKDFYLTSGVHFNRHWMQLDYAKTTETIQFLENVVVAFDLELLANDTIFYYGDTSVTTINEREIRHHNRYDKLKIPILFGKKWNRKRFTYGAHAGVGLDIWIRQTGKNLQLDEFKIYDSKDPSTSETFPKLGWSLDFRGDLNYRIGKNMNLFLQPNLNIPLSDWSIQEDGISQKPIIFGLNLGLQKKF